MLVEQCFVIWKCKCTYVIGTKPAITVHPSSQAITLISDTEILSLKCQAVGATSYYWERQDGSIPSGAIGVDSKTLTLVNLSPQDGGNYQCVASDGSDKIFSSHATIALYG